MKNAGTTLLTLIMIFSLQCQTVGEREDREVKILTYTPDKVNVFEKYLVTTDQYTTEEGKRYHAKYFNHLIGLARVLSEEKRFTLVEKTIGFYYDKKRRDEKKLFLGVDMQAPESHVKTDAGYGHITATLLKKNISVFLPVLLSCKSIFDEPYVDGFVVGMRWRGTWKNELFNFWIRKDDALLLENSRITLEELIERNTITDTEGSVIRLIK